MYLVRLSLLPHPVHVCCKGVNFQMSSLRSTFYWSWLQMPMWRSQPRHVIRLLTRLIISQDIRTILCFYFSTLFLIQSNPTINHFNFGICLLNIEIQFFINISWIMGGDYAISLENMCNNSTNFLKWVSRKSGIYYVYMCNKQN